MHLIETQALTTFSNVAETIQTMMIWKIRTFNI